MKVRRFSLPLGLLGLLVTVMFVAGCSPQSPEPVVVTVVNTVPVEVTRMVEVQQTVEVIREVIVTEIVEVQVPVTVTPNPEPEATATPEPGPTSTEVVGGGIPAAQPTATIDLDEFQDKKIQGLSILKVINETDINLTVQVQGLAYLSLAVSGNNSAIEIIPEGEYTYQVWEEGELRYSGTMSFTNPDKHELVIHNNRVVFKVP